MGQTDGLEEQRRIMSLVKDIDGRRPEGNELLDVLGIEGIETSGQLTVEAAKLMLMDKAPLSQWMVKTRSEQVGQLSSRQPILHALPLPEDDGDVGWDYDLEKEVQRPDSQGHLQHHQEEFHTPRSCTDF